MKRKKLTLLLFIFCAVNGMAQKQWHSPMVGNDPFICGRAWNQEIGHEYSRLPERLRGNVSEAVWKLSRQSAGMSVRFLTNSSNITVRYKLQERSKTVDMSKLLTDGVDLYATNAEGVTHWIGSHQQWKFSSDSVEMRFGPIVNKVRRKSGLLFTLYLPAYSHINNLEIGVDDEATFTFVHQSAERPVVIYGTSIQHGTSATRPGNMVSARVERALGYPVVNLGFSGSALIEPGMFDVLAETDARAFIIDPMPNSYSLHPDTVYQRTVTGIRRLRAKSKAPILMVEAPVMADHVLLPTVHEQYLMADGAFHRAYDQLMAEGTEGLHYLGHDELGITEDAMVEGIHPNDIGMKQYADVYIGKLREMLPEDKANPLFLPVTQFRDGGYNRFERHNEVIRLNHTTDPEILLIGNSITHFMGGYPIGHVNNGKSAFKRTFGKRRVVNMGMGWDRIENVYWRIFHGELEGCTPRHIVLLIGINNLDYNRTIKEIAQGITGLAALIQDRQPQAMIHVIEVFPCRGRVEKVKLLNEELRRQFVPNPRLELLDMSHCFLRADGRDIDPEMFVDDGLHPSEAGYLRYGRELKKHLQ